MSMMKNSSAYLLANIASRFIPPNDFSPDRFYVELTFRPFVPDNLEHWQVFEDDDQIIRFMENSKEFIDSQINFLVDSMDLEVVNLQNNTLPKGCVPLENLFDRHDVFKRKKSSKQIDEP